MKLYASLFTASLRARMQYKADFLLSMLGNGMIMAIDYLLLFVILRRFGNIKGWTASEVGLLYALSTVSVSLYRMIANEIHNFDRYTVEGEMDQLLIRPVSPVFMLLIRNIDFSRLGGLAQGIMILAWSLFHLPSGVDGQALLFYVPVAVCSGTLIAVAMGLMSATLAFWTERISDFQPFTLYGPFQAANFPVTIYPGWLKVLFHSFLPVAFMNFWPIAHLLHKGGSVHLLWVSPLFSVSFFVFAVLFFHVGLKHYHSTGS
jgi:ABC-2 type transport system permease protein